MKWGLIIYVLLCPTVACPPQSGMNLWLNSGTDEERLRKLESIGVERDKAVLGVGGGFEWRPIRSSSENRFAILFQPCGALDSAFLYLVESNGSEWKVTDAVGFDCHYDESVSVEVAQLRTPATDDVLVHHECEGHGTGFLQQNFNVFLVKSSKFELKLNVEEVVQASGVPVGSHKLRQTSSFVAIRSRKSPIQIIRETRHSVLNGRRWTEERSFRWSEAKARFVSTPFIKQSDIPRKSKATRQNRFPGM